MDYEISKPISTRYIWPKGDKGYLFRIQIVVSALIIFLGIIQATNVFLLNKAQDNPITFGFFVTVILIVILSALTIFWSLKTSKHLMISDNSQNATNTKFSQILLFLTLTLFTLYIVFFTLFQFAKEDLFNSAMASSSNGLQKYQQAYNDHKQWVEVLGYVNMILVIFTAFTQQVMTDSRVCGNLMIFLFSICLLYVSFYIIHSIGVLYSVFNYPAYNFDTFPLTSLKMIAIITIVLLILTVIINLRKKEVSYLLLGTLLLLTLVLVVPATGKIFREYKTASTRYTNNCAEELGHLDHEYLSDQGCKQKYHYRENSPKDCGNRFDDCFESIENLRKSGIEPKRFITTVWEESLYPKSIKEPRLAGLTQECCGTVVNIYSRPFLKVAALALTYIILVFLLVCFLYSNSSHSSQQSSQSNELQLSGASKNILVGVFFGLLVVGGIFTCVSGHSSDIVRRDTVVVNKLISIKTSHPSNTYHEYNKCTLFQYFEEESLVNQDYRPIMFADLNIQQASNQYCEGCTNPDLLIVLSAVRENSDSCPSDFRFDYPIVGGKVHVIPSSLVQPLTSDQVCFDPATKHNRCVPCQSYFGVSGDPIAVLNYVRTQVSACNRQGLKFIVQTYQVDPSLFAAHQEGSNEKTTSSFKQTLQAQQPQQQKKAIIHTGRKSNKKNNNLDNPRLLAGLKKHTISLLVRDLVTNKSVSGAEIRLYEGYEGENTCYPGSNAKLIFNGVSDSLGQLDLDFLYAQVPTTRYTVHVISSSYSENCRTFVINENRKFLDVGLSAGLKQHQTRFVLEWGSESALETTQDMDLYLGSNSEAENWVCYSSYFSSQCAGAFYHGDAKGEKVSTESITVENLGQSSYLVFYKLPVVSASNGVVDNAVISQLKPIVKVYTYGQNKPTQYSVFDNALQKGTYTDYEKNFRNANLAWCINGQNSEIVKNAKGFSYAVAWQVADPDNSSKYDLPLSSVLC